MGKDNLPNSDINGMYVHNFFPANKRQNAQTGKIRGKIVLKASLFMPICPSFMKYIMLNITKIIAPKYFIYGINRIIRNVNIPNVKNLSAVSIPNGTYCS